MNSFIGRLFLTGILVLTTASTQAEDSILYQMKVQRACEAAVWGMPAVGIYDIELSIQRDLGGKFETSFTFPNQWRPVMAS